MIPAALRSAGCPTGSPSGSPRGPPPGRRRDAARRLPAAAAAARAPGPAAAGRRPARRPRRDHRRRWPPGCWTPGWPSPTCPPAARGRRHRRRPGQGPARRAGPAARRAARGPGDRATCRWSWSTTARPMPVRGPTASGVLRHATARGPAAARNAGLRGRDDAVVAFLDSDCVPRPGWLDAAARRTSPIRGWPLVAPRIVALPGGRRGLAGARTRRRPARWTWAPHPAPVRPLSAVSYVPSAALLARRAALGDGFDETMRVAEDVDLVWRLAAAGWRVRYEPARARSRTSTPPRPADWLRRRAFYGTGAALLAARHGSAVAPVVLAPESAPAWALALAGGRRGRGGGRRRARRHRGPAGAPAGAGPGSRAARASPPGSCCAGTARRRADAGPRGHPAPLAAGAGRRRRLAAGPARSCWPSRSPTPSLAWWPQRQRVGPVRFAARPAAGGPRLRRGAVVGRRAGARRPRALLPGPAARGSESVARNRHVWWKPPGPATMGVT